MLGNPPIPPYGMELGDENGEVENYEVSGILVINYHSNKSYALAKISP